MFLGKAKGLFYSRTFERFFNRVDSRFTNKQRLVNILHVWTLVGLYHPLDGITNLKYKLRFLTPNKKIKRERDMLLPGIDAAI